ncbi:hypothetical protein OTK51_18195 [Vibrio scophthalmi]|uniref:hypothetical protein n=1 Tax=Vibrio scophthalmi TaxID=45658 RepID=UPI002284DE94|nr:hypothetical protein [Vibrio scophthalmi]MCY9805358.1 hypothetical protein [Vibrio scophthalmi]
MNFAFNELSETTINSCADLDSFYEQIRDLEKIAALDDFPSIVFTDDFASKNYNGLGTAYDLLKNSRLEKEKLDHFKSIIVNAPFSSSIQSADDQYTYNSIDTKGMQYSVINDVHSISIPGPTWSQYNYTVDKTSICPITINIITSPFNVNHLGDLKNIQGTWLQQYLPITTFTDARSFISNIPQKYPNVILSPHARAGLTGFNKAKLHQLERAMAVFEDYCNNHWGAGFNKAKITRLGIKIKDESSETMNVEKYYKQRNFTNENGDIENIPLHFNISEDHRGNIKATSDKKIFIAYLGYHLDTVKYN